MRLEETFWSRGYRPTYWGPTVKLLKFGQRQESPPETGCSQGGLEQWAISLHLLRFQKALMAGLSCELLLRAFGWPQFLQTLEGGDTDAVRSVSFHHSKNQTTSCLEWWLAASRLVWVPVRGAGEQLQLQLRESWASFRWLTWKTIQLILRRLLSHTRIARKGYSSLPTRKFFGGSRSWKLQWPRKL